MGNRASRTKQIKPSRAAAFILLLVAVAGASAPEKLQWVVKDGRDVDRRHGETIYLSACRWVEQQVEADEPVRPRLTIHVGETCPQSRIAGACMNPILGELYLPEWDEESPYAVAEATVATAMHQLNNRDRSTSGMLLARGSTSGAAHSMR